MADNVSITAGSGTTILADEVTHGTWGSGKAQVIKIIDGTVDGTTEIASGNGTATNALRVTLASNTTGVVAVTDNSGSLTVDYATTGSGTATGALRVELPTNGTGVLATVGTVTTVGTVSAISAGENHLGEVGGKTAYRVITMSADTGVLASGDLIADTQQYDAFFRKTDGTGVINSITIAEKDAQGAAYYIYIHRTSTSMGTENNAPNISDANFVAGIQHIISVATTDFVAVSGVKVATLRNLGLPVMAVSGTDDLYFSIVNSTGTPTYASGEIQLGIGVLLD